MSRIAVVSFALLMVLGCGGEEGGGQSGSSPPETSPRVEPAGHQIFMKLSLSPLPEGFPPELNSLDDRASVTLTKREETWVTTLSFPRGPSAFDRDKTEKKDLKLDGFATFSLPLLWKPGEYELVAGAFDRYRTKDSFCIATEGAPGSPPVRVRMRAGAKAIVEVKRVEVTKIRRNKREKYSSVTLQLDILIAGRVPLVVERATEGENGRFQWDGEPVGETEATFEIAWYGQVMLPFAEYDWLPK